MKLRCCLLMGLITAVSLVGCGTTTEIGYAPPLIPIRVSVDTQGQIKTSFDNHWRTPIGTFDLEVDTTLAQISSQQTQKMLIVKVDNTAMIYALDPGKEFHVEFVAENHLYRKVRLEHHSNGNILLELESTAMPHTALTHQTANRHMDVHADADWQNTGIIAQAGDTLNINYVSGKWSNCPRAGCPYVDADGVIVRHIDAPDNVLPNCNHAAVLVRISDKTSCAGNNWSIVVEETGGLLVRINDRVLDDNEGVITIRIGLNSQQ